MKKLSQKSVVLVLFVIGMLTSSLAVAAVGNIKNTKHNFSFSGGSAQYRDGGNELNGALCIYCHTPHNAGQTNLLWNKANPTGVSLTFRFYSSGSTTSAAKNAAFTSDSPSLLCLSCHDGKSAMNVLHSGGMGTAAAGYPAGSSYAFAAESIPITMSNAPFMFGDPDLGVMIGGSIDATTVDLRDDHPVGFSYKDVYDERVSKGTSLGLRSPDAAVTASGDKVRLFGGSNQKVECSSCHDPHVDYNAPTGNTALKPFLVMSNTGSALCLSCHDK